MESEVGLDRIRRRCRDERRERSLDRFGTGRVHSGRRERGRLALDPQPEVDHVEDVVVGPDGRRFDGERGRFGHREHERATALEGFDQALCAKPGDRLPDDGAGHAELLDEFCLGGQLVARRQVAGEDLVLQPGDDPQGQ